jgi:hypothetical protein
MDFLVVPTVTGRLLYVLVVMTHVRRDMTTLSGIVAALDAYSLEHKRPVTLPLVGTLDSMGVVWVILVICVLMVAKGALAVLVTWWATRRIPRYEVAIEPPAWAGAGRCYGVRATASR